MALAEEEICAGFRRRLALLIKERGFGTPKAVADRLGEAGTPVGEMTVRKWLREGRISEPNLLSLAALLGVTPWGLRYGADETAPATPSLMDMSAMASARRGLMADILGVYDCLDKVCGILGASVWKYDLMTGKLMIDGEVEAIYGASAKDLALDSPDALLGLIHPQDRATFARHWSNALLGSASPAMSLRIQWNAYSEGVPTQAWISPQVSRNGHVIALIGVVMREENNNKKGTHNEL
jgi:hypothetical protein